MTDNVFLTFMFFLSHKQGTTRLHCSTDEIENHFQTQKAGQLNGEGQ